MNDKKNKLIFIGIFILIVIIIVSVFFIFFMPVFSKNIYKTKTSVGQVSIDLTPKGIVDGKFTFDIEVNTHTINNLNEYDIKQNIIMNYDKKSIKPIFAPQLSSHHNSGVLVFDLNKAPKEFSINIIGIPDVNERSLKWK